MALQHALDRARVEQRVEVEGLEFGQDGRGPDQAVARRQRRVRLEAPADGQDGPLHLRREALGDGVVGPGPVVKPRRACLQVAAPPLVEPDLGAADRGANHLDGTTRQAQGNSALTSSQFVVPGDLRVAAAGGCRRRSFYTVFLHRRWA
jgi:hypothetical protein